MSQALPYWKAKSLAAMSRAEWEGLCDGCGRCCLHKLRDEDTDALAWTNVACRLLDTATGRCGDYANRRDRVPDCIKLTPSRLARIDWLPPTCAYRLVQEGRDLPDWHPLVSGDGDTVRRAGVSVRGRVVSERDAGALEDHVADWPGRWPRGTAVPGRRAVAAGAAPGGACGEEAPARGAPAAGAPGGGDDNQ